MKFESVLSSALASAISFAFVARSILKEILMLTFGPSRLSALVFPCHDPIYCAATICLELQKDFEGRGALP